MSFFPYERISDFFEAEGDFEENLDSPDEAPWRMPGDWADLYESDALDLQRQDAVEMRAEMEQEHWEQDPEYRSLYFPPVEQDVMPCGCLEGMHYCE